MALQGTIETFALPEVLRLLGSGAKTGRLRLSGDRGSGSVWIDGGKVIGADATGVRDGAAPVAVLFELLRFGEGSFTFDVDETTDQRGTPQDIEAILDEAMRRVAEWRGIEAVVPSLAVGLSLVADLPANEVVIDVLRWKAIVAVAGGGSVSAVADALDLDELEACRCAKDLVEAGLVAVSELEPALPPVDDLDVMVADPEPPPGDPAPVNAPWATGPAAPVQEPAPVALPSYDGPSAEPDPFALHDGGLGELSVAEESYATPAVDRYGADPYGTQNGFGSTTQEPASSARAELDAMASGFGLADSVPETQAYDQGRVSDGGSVFEQEFGTGGAGGFHQGFASDPSEDPAFSFAAPDAAPGEFGGFGGFEGASSDGQGLAGPMGAGPALFAEDVASVGDDAPFTSAGGGFDADDTGDAAEVARQLANLSPKAARAVAAAARATTVEEREAALAEVTSEGDEPINRGLLLKFLSSVQS